MANNERFWALVRNLKILMDDSPISGKNSEQMSPNFEKFWPKTAYFQTLCSETSDLHCKKSFFKQKITNKIANTISPLQVINREHN